MKVTLFPAAEEREHCVEVAKAYLAYERLPPYDEEWHLASTIMSERAAAVKKLIVYSQQLELERAALVGRLNKLGLEWHRLAGILTNDPKSPSHLITCSEELRTAVADVLGDGWDDPPAA